MKAFATGSLLAVVLATAGCGGEFTALGNEPGRGGNGAVAGMAGASASGGTAAAGAPGMGGAGGSGAAGGSGGTAAAGAPGMGGAGGSSGAGGSGASAQCTTDGDCGKSLSTCVTCSDGSQNCPWTHCESGQCASGWSGCGTPAPCAGKSCGDACSTCTGTDPCPGVAMFCDQNLTCQVNEPVCGATMCTTSADCTSTALPALKTCGDGSTVTESYECVSGQCEWVFPSCPPECSTDTDCPKSKAVCTQCADGSTACPWAHCVMGQCTTGVDTCPAPADPCAGKSCGDTCTTCTGSGPCNAMAMYCDENLKCQVNEPVCGAMSCMTSADCVSSTCSTCPGQPSTMCAGLLCISGQCTPDCAGVMPCGTCGAGTTCVYQTGGAANPEGFRCATQDPCGSNDPCACIVGEGTCSVIPDTTGYCSCDNGIR